MFLACDVPWKDHGFASRVLDPARGLIGVLLLAQIGNHDIGALAGEGDGDCPADTRIRARDQRHFPSEAPCPGVTLLAVVRNRLHLIRQTRRRLLLLRLGRKGPVVSVRHGHLQPMNLEGELSWGLDVPYASGRRPFGKSHTGPLWPTASCSQETGQRNGGRRDQDCSARSVTRATSPIDARYV